MKMDWKAMRGWMDRDGRDAILDRLGLEERTPAGDFFTGLGLFSIGVLVGAGLGLMFAPKRGEEMRAALNDAWKNRGKVGQELRDLGAEAGVVPGAHGH
jgi:hypothetical protein